MKPMSAVAIPAEQLRHRAESLVRRYADMRAGEILSFDQATRAEDAALPPTQAAVLPALRMLQFVEHDAQILAKAWQAQSDRSGQFDPLDWPDEPQDFGLSRTSSLSFPACPPALGLYAVLPDATWVRAMAQAGVPTLQLRFKSSDSSAIGQQVRAAVRAVADTNALLFINDHWRQAIDEGAYGVHLGQEDLADTPLETLRAAGLRLGLSTHGYAEMLRADAAAPSYLALGAVFPTTLKRMVTLPQGTARLRAYARLMKHHSLVAIGGIDAARIPEVLRSGVGSVAVVRAIVGEADPVASAKMLMKLVAVHR